jgi:hypothetical protein
MIDGIAGRNPASLIVGVPWTAAGLMALAGLLPAGCALAAVRPGGKAPSLSLVAALLVAAGAHRV